MGNGRVFFLSVVFLLTVMRLQPCCAQYKISAPRVLLPRAGTVITNYTLRVTDGDDLGCFSWESTRPDVVAVQAMAVADDEHKWPSSQLVPCSSAAVVSAVARSGNRLTSIVWAQSPGQGERFRCDVIVDSITSIEIETTTQELFLEDAPEAFEIRAKDAKGDTFSSLEGLEFEWTIHNDNTVQGGNVNAYPILKMTKFADTQYRPPSTISELEERGRRGFMVLVEGLQTGSAIVSATLKDSNVPSTSVRIVVVANLMLLPPHDIYLLQHGTIHYRVQQIKQASSFDIDMPSKQYYLDIIGDNVCKLDGRTGSTVTCGELGEAQVVLKDRTMQQADGHLPSAVIHVVQVAYINLVILPGRSWILEKGRWYEMMVELYDVDSHRIYLSDNVHINFQLDREFFGVLQSAHNGSYHSVMAKKTGKTTVSAQLASVDGVEFDNLPALNKRQNVDIFDRVDVKPSILAIPHQAGKEYHVRMRANGGSGNYSWSSNKSQVVDVDKTSGLAKLGAREGLAMVTASDIRNVAHYATARLYVLPVADLRVLPSLREAQVSTSLILPIAAAGRIAGSQQMLPFYDCRKLTMRVSISDEKIFVTEGVSESEMTGRAMQSVGQEGGCTFVKLRALTTGFAKVTVSYSAGDKEDSPMIATQQITIAAFPILRSAEGPTMESVVLAVGSSKLFHFKGGPAPWIDSPAGHNSVVVAKDKVTVSRTVGGSTGSALKEVTCTSLGKEEMTLQVSNAPSKTLPKPVTAQLKLQVLCAEPASFSMTPVVDHDTSLGLPQCPWQSDESSDSPFPILVSSPAAIELRVFDEAGREFYNFSSLHFAWNMANSRLLSLAASKEKGLDVNGKRQGLQAHDKTGRTKVEVTLDGYTPQGKVWLKEHHNLHAPHLTHKLHSVLEVVLVQQPSFDKDRVVLFNHPDNQESVAIRDGSGFFHIVSSQPSMAKVRYELKSRSLAVVAGQEHGQLLITAYDVCTSARPIQLPVTVVGLQRLQLLLGDKVQLGKSIPALLRVYDTENEVLPVKNYPLIDLQFVLTGDSLVLKEDSKQASEHQRMYLLSGATVGRCRLTFTARQVNATTLTSNTVDIQVFPPLRLEPRNVTLLPAAQFQLGMSGGPQPLTSFRFVSGKSSVSSVDTQSGLIEGHKVGSNVVIAQVLDVDPVTEKEVILSQDEVQVHVVDMKSLTIHAPTVLIEVGQEVPLLAMGLPPSSQTPFAFGSVTPHIKFSWSLDNTEVATIVRQAFTARLMAKNAGVVTVSLKGNNMAGQVRIKVVEALRVVGMGGCNERSLLMTPNTRAALKTSRDGQARMTYRIVEGEDVLQIDHRGDMTSGARTGLAAVEASAEEAGLLRTVLTHIEVKEPSYLTINTVSDFGFNWTTEGETKGFPVGLAMSLHCRLHDELGRPFYASKTSLKLVKHRNDLLETSWDSKDNMTFIVKPLKEGRTIIKVSDSDRENIFDFINLDALSSITPAADIIATVGDVMCYQCPVMGRDGHGGRWSSTTPGLVHMASADGVALALSPGAATIQYSLSPRQIVKSQLTIQPIQHLGFDKKTLMIKPHISNSLSQSPLAVPVSLGGNDVGRKGCDQAHLREVLEDMRRLWHGERELFGCVVEFDQVHPSGIVANDVFESRAQVLDDAHFGCTVQARKLSDDMQRALSPFEAHVLLSLRSTTTAPTQEVETLQVNFYPAIHVDTREVHVKQHKEGFLTLTATPTVKAQLQLKSSHPDSLQIGTPSKVEDDGPHRWRYPLTFLPHTHPFPSSPLHVNISSPGTQQEVVMPIKVTHMAGSQRSSEEGPGFSSENFWSLYAVPGVIIGLLMAVVALLYCFWQEDSAAAQYRRYYAIAGHAPPSANQRASPLSISPGKKTISTPPPTKSFNQSFLGPPVATLFKREEGTLDNELSDGLGNVHLYSTNRRLTSPDGSPRGY